MAIEVEGPDGVTIEFPDGTTNDVIKGVMSKRYQQASPKAPATVADVASDAAMQAAAGPMSGLMTLVNAPYRMLDWAGEKLTGGDFLPDADKMVLNRHYIGDQSPKPQTEAGRYVRSMGEAVGSSVLPTAGLISKADKWSKLAPTTTANSIRQSFGGQIAARPGAAVVADVAAATGSGALQQGAQEAGFGPGGQTVAAIAGGFAPLAAGQGIAHLTQAGRSAMASKDPYARVAAKLGDSTVDDLAGGVATGATRMDEATNRRTLDVLGQEMVRAGGDPAAAQRAAIARMVAEDGIAQATAQSRVRNLTSVHRDSDLMFGEYPAVAAGNQATRRQRPANVTDEAAGRMDDAGTHWEIDNVANSGGGASASQVRNAVTQRADDLAESTRQVVQRMAPNGQTIQDTEALIQGLTRQANAEYRQVHSAQGNVNYGMLHGLLRRVVDRHTQRMYGRSGEQFDVLEDAINSLYTTAPVQSATRSRAAQPGIEDQVSAARRAVREARRNRLPRDQIIALERQADDLVENMRLNRRGTNPGSQQILMPSLQMLQDMRGGIRGQIKAARQAGETHKVSQLQPLYRDLTRIMERASPDWARANRRWADMSLDEVAQDLGDALSKTAGPRFREQMTEFLRLAPEAQNVVRIHFVQKLLDQVDNAVKLGKMKDLGAQFSSAHMRATVRAVLGDEAAVQMSRLIRDWNVATKSGKMIGGSPTAMRLARRADDDQDLGILASIDQASVSGFRKWALDWTVNRFRERRHREVGRITTTPMRDTAAVAENLERMRGASIRADQLSQPVRLPPGTGGKTGGIIAEGNDEDSPLGGIAFEATGVPSVVRGVNKVRKAYQEGDALQGAAGVGEAALGIMPGAGLFRGGRAALNTATSTVPRAAATMGGAMLPMAAADVRDARAAGLEKIQAAVENDPKVQRLRGRLEQLRKELAESQGPIKGLNKASADDARKRKAEPIQAEIDALVGAADKPGLIQQAEAETAKNFMDNAPFRERYPGTAEALLYGGGALAFGLPALNTMRHKWADRYVHAPSIERQAQKVEDAARGTTAEPSRLARAMGAKPTTTPPNQAAFETEREVLRNKIAARDKRSDKADWKSSALPSAAIIAEARMLPEEIDALSYPPGHPARVAAEEKLTSVGYYTGSVVPSVLGGGAAAYYGNKLGSMASPSTMAMPRGEAASAMRFKGERAPAAEGPGSIARIKEALTQRAESWLLPRQRPETASAPLVPRADSPGAIASGSSPSRSPSNALLQESFPSPGSRQTQPLPQGSSSARASQTRTEKGSSSAPAYEGQHKEVTQKVMESYMRAGSVPQASQMRDDIMSAFKRAGVQAPAKAEITKRINVAQPMLEAAKDAPQDVKDRILKAMMKSPGFLTVPAAVGVGAATVGDQR